MEDVNVIQKKCLNFTKHKFDSYSALHFIVNLFTGDIYPYMKSLSKKILKCKEGNVTEETLLKIRNIYVLCADQMKKCFTNFLDIIRAENKEGLCFVDSRHCILERISWCYDRLLITEEQLNKILKNDGMDNDTVMDFSLLDSMYFVNWVDQTFEILGKISSLVYKTNYEDEIAECVRGLHTSIDELLLCAMTLCKYCLHSDQKIVKTRCQVVLRETKLLLSDLVIGDLDSMYQATKDNLKLPIMPFNVCVQIDVLKDVLYALETNTNTSLLALLVHSFSLNVSPANMLKNHLNNSLVTCTCVYDTDADIEEKCMFVRSFDLYNERLLQIGTFAMSCSCDEKRILGLRSGLASLEALDPHFVPALMISPTSHHSALLMKIWNDEVMQIRNNVFLIVDPAAFAEKAKQIMHHTLLELMKAECYDNSKSCSVINIGFLVYEFFDVYNKQEPEALPQNEKLQPLLADLYKAQRECKVVSNSLCTDGDFLYDAKKTNIKVSLDKFIKRLQLLYTIVKRIYFIFTPKDNDEEFYDDEQVGNRNNTYTLNVKKQATYVNSPRKNNITKSIFARTNKARCTPRQLPLAILTRRLKTKTDFSFSMKLDDMCNLSEIKKTRESSILYHSNFKTKSLRKAVLNNQLMLDINDGVKPMVDVTQTVNIESFMDESMNLQITDVLNQLNNLTASMAANVRRPFNSTAIVHKHTDKRFMQTHKEIEENVGVVNKEGDSMNMSQPSDVNTLERIGDLDLVESKLSDLRFGHIETSL